MKVSFVILLILLIGLFIFTFYRSIIYSPNTHTQENFIADFDNVMDNYCKLNFENRHNYIGPWDKKELVGCDFEACSLEKCWYLNQDDTNVDKYEYVSVDIPQRRNSDDKCSNGLNHDRPIHNADLQDPRRYICDTQPNTCVPQTKTCYFFSSNVDPTFHRWNNYEYEKYYDMNANCHWFLKKNADGTIDPSAPTDQQSIEECTQASVVPNCSSMTQEINSDSTCPNMTIRQYGYSSDGMGCMFLTDCEQCSDPDTKQCYIFDQNDRSWNTNNYNKEFREVPDHGWHCAYWDSTDKKDVSTVYTENDQDNVPPNTTRCITNVDTNKCDSGTHDPSFVECYKQTSALSEELDAVRYNVRFSTNGVDCEYVNDDGDIITADRVCPSVCNQGGVIGYSKVNNNENNILKCIYSNSDCSTETCLTSPSTVTGMFNQQAKYVFDSTASKPEDVCMRNTNCLSDEAAQRYCNELDRRADVNYEYDSVQKKCIRVYKCDIPNFECYNSTSNIFMEYRHENEDTTDNRSRCVYRAVNDSETVLSSVPDPCETDCLHLNTLSATYTKNDETKTCDIQCESSDTIKCINDNVIYTFANTRDPAANTCIYVQTNKSDSGAADLEYDPHTCGNSCNGNYYEDEVTRTCEPRECSTLLNVENAISYTTSDGNPPYDANDCSVSECASGYKVVRNTCVAKQCIDSDIDDLDSRAIAFNTGQSPPNNKKDCLISSCEDGYKPDHTNQQCINKECSDYTFLDTTAHSYTKSDETVLTDQATANHICTKGCNKGYTCVDANYNISTEENCNNGTCVQDIECSVSNSEGSCDASCGGGSKRRIYQIDKLPSGKYANDNCDENLPQNMKFDSYAVGSTKNVSEYCNIRDCTPCSIRWSDCTSSDNTCGIKVELFKSGTVNNPDNTESDICATATGGNSNPSNGTFANVQCSYSRTNPPCPRCGEGNLIVSDATTYTTLSNPPQSVGDCKVASCADGYHTNSDLTACEAYECGTDFTIDNATEYEEIQTPPHNVDDCAISECNAGYTVSLDKTSCVPKTCEKDFPVDNANSYNIGTNPPISTSDCEVTCNVGYEFINDTCQLQTKLKDGEYVCAFGNCNFSLLNNIKTFTFNLNSLGRHESKTRQLYLNQYIHDVEIDGSKMKIKGVFPNARADIDVELDWDDVNSHYIGTQYEYRNYGWPRTVKTGNYYVKKDNTVCVNNDKIGYRWELKIENENKIDYAIVSMFIFPISEKHELFRIKTYWRDSFCKGDQSLREERSLCEIASNSAPLWWNPPQR